MKIVVTPESETNHCSITSVFVDVSANRCDVLINTLDRWVPFHRQGSSLDVEIDETGRAPVHQHFVIGTGSSATGLTLIAESRDDANALRRRCFSSQDKEQIEFVFLEHPDDMRTIASWSAPS